MARSSTWFIVLAAVVGFAAIYCIYTMTASSYVGLETQQTLVDATTLQHRCVWREGDPVIYHLRTKMGVNYDAGHWFHMAENFMVQRSILRQSKLLSNASHVLYSFDKGIRGFSTLFFFSVFSWCLTLLCRVFVQRASLMT
jgi:hypothetical protein